MKKISLYEFFAHLYMFIAVLAFVFFWYIDTHVGKMLYTFGPYSWGVAFALSTSDRNLNLFVRVFLFFWSVIFPILLSIFYVKIYKKKYVPFFVVTSIDTLISFSWFIYYLIINDEHLRVAAEDGIVSMIVSLTLLISLILNKKRGNKSVIDDQGGDIIPETP